MAGRRWPSFVFAFLVVFAIAACGRAAPHPEVLDAIRIVEGVKDPARRGPAGELGFFRMIESSWVLHTREPFSRAATDPDFERMIAAKHLAFLEDQLRAAGLAPTPYTLALAWNAGVSAVIADRTRPAQRDYARRARNLCQ